MTAARDADELRRIERFALREGARFGLAMVIHADRVLAAEDRRRLSEELRAKGRRVVNLEIGYDDDETDVVARLVVASRDADVVFVDGLERLAIDAYGHERHTKALLNLNLARDHLPELLSARVVFWVGKRGHASLHNRAADLCRVMLTTAELSAERKTTRIEPLPERPPVWYRLAPEAERGAQAEQLANFTLLYEGSVAARSRADAAMSASKLAIALGQLSDAVEWLRRAVEANEASGAISEAADAARRIVEIDLFRGRLDEAGSWVVRARELAAREDDVPSEREGLRRRVSLALALALQAELRARRGETREALEQLEREILPVLASAGRHVDRAAVLSQIAELLEARDELDRALELRRAQIEPLLVEAAESEDVEAQQYANLRSIGEIELRRGHFEVAASIAERLHDEDLLRALGHARGEVALPRSAAALAIVDTRDRARLLGEQAIYARQVGKREHAIVLRREQLDILTELDDVAAQALTIADIVELELELGRWVGAAQYAAQMLERAERVGEVELLARAQALGRLAREQRVRDEPEHVFIVHDERDKRLVLRLCTELLARGVRPWVDVWDLLPGAAWAQRREEALLQAPMVLVVVGPHGAGDLQAALVARTYREPGSVLRIALPGAVVSAPAVELSIAEASWSDDLDRVVRRIGPSTTRARWLEIEARALEVGASMLEPYRGLATHRERDARWLFGRDAEVDALLERVASDVVVVVVGVSGSGKSSLVLAGLCPMLRNGALDHRRELAIMRPGSSPCRSLVHALAELGLVCEHEQLLSTSSALRACLAERELVLVVDQLEELFMAAKRGDSASHEVDAFLANLAAATSGETKPLRVVATLRADHYGEALARPWLAHALHAGAYTLESELDETRLHAMIEGPARRVGYRVEPVLLERLKADVAERPNPLPLLQHVLYALWQRRDAARRMLTLAAYEESGGFDSAIAHAAERILAGLRERLGGDAEPATRRVLTRLVAPGETAATDARRRMTPTELGPEDSTMLVVDAFARAALIEVGEHEGDPIELAHEALLHSWPRLAGWVEDERAALRVREQIAKASADWRAHRNNPEYLWGRGRTEEARRVLATSTIGLDREEQAFLDACTAKARRRALLFGSVVGVLVLVVVAVLLGFAYANKQLADGARRVAESEQEARKATEETVAIEKGLRASLLAEKLGPYTDAALLAIEATRGYEVDQLPPPVYEGVLAVLGMWPVVEVARHDITDTTEIDDIGVSEGGEVLAISEHGRTYVIQPKTERIQVLNGVGALINIRFLAGGQVAGIGRDGALNVCFVEDGSCVTHATGVHDYAYSGDTRLAAVGEDRVTISDVDTGNTATVIGLSQKITDIAFLPSMRISAMTESGGALTWNWESGDLISGMQSDPPILGKRDVDGVSVTSLLGDHRVVVMRDSCPLESWGYASGNEAIFGNCKKEVWEKNRVLVSRATGHGAYGVYESLLMEDLVARNVHFWDSPTSFVVAEDSALHIFTLGGVKVATMPHRHYSFGDRGYFAVSSDNAVSIFRVRRPVRLRRSADLSSLFGNYIKVRMSNYATDRIVAIDRGLATLRDGRVMLVRNTSKLPSYIRGVAISRIDHHAIVVADLEGRISAWDISSVEWPKVMFAFHTRSPAPEVGTFSNDRIHYACPATRGRVQIWDIGTGMPVTVAEDFGTVSALQFSPSGSTLAIGGERGRIYLWKLDSQEMVSMADSVGDAPIGKVAFSPDGSHLAGANDEYLGIWNIVSNSLDYRAPARGIKDIVFSRDGEKVAASVKESVIVWDMATRHMAVGTLPVAPSVIAFDDHGRHLITYEAGIVVYWPMPEVAVPLLCQQIRDAHRYREVADICDPLLAAAAAKTP